MRPFPSMHTIAVGSTHGITRIAHKWFAFYSFQGFANPSVFTVDPPTDPPSRVLPCIRWTMQALYTKWVVSSVDAPRWA